MPPAATDEWATPAALFARLDERYGPFTLDVAAAAENAQRERYFTREDDGLAQPWEGRVWCNPPYGAALPAWMAKASGCDAELVCCLVPARTDTRWWHAHAARGEVEFLPGRLRFDGAANSAPVPSAVVVFRNGQTVAQLGSDPSQRPGSVPGSTGSGHEGLPALRRLARGQALSRPLLLVDVPGCCFLSPA